MPISADVLNGRYRLIQRAGAGGMSTVYKGQDLLLGRLVAIKILHESLTGDEEFLRRFQQEAHKAANLSHPNIVTVHDIGQDDRRYYIIMEFVEGWTLKDIVRQHVRTANRPLSIERALNIAIQICSGVGYAHRAGLVHCDVKSLNVLVARDESTKVTDFGIARAMSETSIHRGDMVWGTPQYFSPEQASGENATPASDVYSIGVILFEMLTGRLPFEADSHTALAIKHIRDVPPFVTEFNPRIPEQINLIVAKVLSKEPSGRYRTADQMGRVLSSYAASSLEETGPVALPEALPMAVPAALFDQEGQVVEEAETDFYLIPDQTIESVQGEADRPERANAGSSAKPNLYLTVPGSDQAIDRTALILSVIALISLLGLIPLWYLVYLKYVG